MNFARLPTVIVLASGRGERFAASGGQVHKLRALLGGKPVLEHTLDAVRASGLPWHLEDAGHPGMGDSIAAAVRATSHSNGWLILPGDLPLVLPSTLRQVAAALKPSLVLVVPVFQFRLAKLQPCPVFLLLDRQPAPTCLVGRSRWKRRTRIRVVERPT